MTIETVQSIFPTPCMHLIPPSASFFCKKFAFNHSVSLYSLASISKLLKSFFIKPSMTQNIMPETIATFGDQGWQKLYELKVTPWDIGAVTPAISDFLSSEESRPIMSSVRRVLVPGCGGGNDVIEFAKYGKECLGVDLSPLAVDIANQRKQQAMKETTSTLMVDFKVTDFFKFNPETPFDLIFDYTFLCALPPTMRPQWAQSIASLLRSGGYLLALQFPLDERTGGPPFALSQGIYHSLLDAHFSLEWVKECRSIEKRDGSEKLSLWKRR